MKYSSGNIMKIASLFACTLCVLGWQSASAAPMTVSLNARVDWVTDPSNALGGQISVGQVFSGTYTYDTATPGVPTATNALRYQATGPQSRVALSSGTISFQSKEDGTQSSDIQIIDNWPQVGWDQQILRYENLKNLSNGALPVNSIEISFNDSSGLALNSTNLPITAPVLGDYNEARIVIVGQSNGQYYLVYLETESVELVVPPTLEIWPASGRRLPNQGFDAVVYLPPGKEPVSVSARLNDGGWLSLGCQPQQLPSSGNWAYSCPNVQWSLWGHDGSPILFTVETTSGETFSQAVEWTVAQ